MKYQIYLFSILLLLFSCESDSGKEDLISQYPEAPDASLMINNGEKGNAVYDLCFDRYKTQLKEIKGQSDSLGAKLLLLIVSPEVGEAVTISTKTGVPKILNLARELNIEAHDLTLPLSKFTSHELTQMPKDGHWSINGAKIIASLYDSVLAKNYNYRSTIVVSNTTGSNLYGDLEPNQNTVLDGGKGLTYQLITNKQGLRMASDVAKKKEKERILFLGDSQLYSPFLDNNQISTSILQQQHSDKEFLNAGVIGYSLDDYNSLLRERARYSQPDIVVIITNPNDISDFFFSQRNKLSRSKASIQPTPEESKFYSSVYGGKK